ncbi:MAG: hypothetical protein HYY95_14155 [Candidatus Rokubacteria bacterium]|nr:hypothetical protein [Candidatus Rokubacteria bacterium]
MRSVSGTQAPPPSIVFHTPPATPAAYMVLELVGSMRMARVRPPILPGPSGVQAPREAVEVASGTAESGALDDIVAPGGGRSLPP